MKYICMGYYEPAKLAAMTEDERNAMFDECFEYDDYLRATGHSAGGEALQPPENALTLYWRNGKVEKRSLQENSLKLYGRATHPRDPSTCAHPGLRDSRGAQDDRVGNFRRTETPREQKCLFSLLHRPEKCAILSPALRGGVASDL
jgi:hypothetical protein